MQSLSRLCQGFWYYNNYPTKRRRIVVDIYRDAKRQGIYPPLFTDPEGDSCFSIYQIGWITKHFFNFFFWNCRETTRHFSLRSQNSEYPRIFRVTEANQNARKLLSTDLVNTNVNYQILLKRIEKYGTLRGIPLKWFTSYLFHRHQYVSLKSVHSSKQTMKCTQGTTGKFPWSFFILTQYKWHFHLLWPIEL